MIFISYRRNDSGGHAGRLFDRLSQWFDDDQLFYDLDGIDMGDTFPSKIQDALDQALVILVVIGSDWIDILNQRTSEQKIDFVRREVEYSLNRLAVKGDIKVIPVLVGGATMPSNFHEKLQATFKHICDCNAHTFQGQQADWNNQFIRLRNKISSVKGLPKYHFRLPVGTEQPFHIIQHSLSAHFQDPNHSLEYLHKTLVDTDSDYVVGRTTLNGMGGIGKTHLALKYSHEYRDNYIGIWWFRAENSTNLQLDSKYCCEFVGAQIRENELASIALKRWLENQCTTWLLVYDNAEDAESLRIHLPEASQHNVIITSRNPAWGGLTNLIRLKTWSTELSVQFLTARLKNQEQENLTKLSKDLDGLPLALEQAASYIEETGISISSYCKLLHNVKSTGLVLDQGSASTGYERSVISTLSVTYEILTPAAARLLRLCAFSSSEPLPEIYFKRAVDILPSEITKATADPISWNNLIRELYCYGLIERITLTTPDGENEEDTEQALILHRLTQEVTRTLLSKPKIDCELLQMILHLNTPEEPRLPINWSKFNILIPHIENLARFYPLGLLNNGLFSWQLNQIATYLRFGPNISSRAIYWFRQSWKINLDEQGEKNIATIISLINLAEALTSFGEYKEARKYQEQALINSRIELGYNHSDTLTCMNNLAITLTELGEYDSAREIQEQAIDIYGEGNPKALPSMNSLAAILSKLGDLEGALKLHTQVLSISKLEFGSKHNFTLTSMNNLASTMHNLGNIHGARELHEEALEGRRIELGEKHSDTMTSKNNLALVLLEYHEYNNAFAYIEEVSTFYNDKFGSTHLATIRAMRNKAAVLIKLNKIDEAFKIQEKNLAICIKEMGDTHPETLANKRNMAAIFFKIGHIHHAIKLIKEVINDYTDTLGEENPNTKYAQNMLKQMVGS